VVATSAMRDARNGSAFQAWVKAETGWNMEIISGLEEGRLIHLGVTGSEPGSGGKVLLLDLGGGSCEITLSEHKRIKETISLPLGAVRLTEQFLTTDPAPREGLARMRQLIARELRKAHRRIQPGKVPLVIATSGTAAAPSEACAGKPASQRTGKQARALAGGLAPAKAVRKLANKLAKMTLPEREAVPGIGPRRAEIIVAGAQVFAELLESFGLAGFRYSPLGLRDGILAQMAADYDRSTRSGRQLESERWESILKAVDHYHVERKHALDVRESAMLLFGGLRSLHRLAPEYREWLSAAAMLYEVGDYVNRNGHHRHTNYIISNSEILGYTPQQRRIIAAIARYLGKSRPTVEDGPMKLIDPADRVPVQKAILLLRLARALNLGRSRAVREVKIGLRSPEVRLTLVPRRNLGVDLELWAIEKERDYFLEVFGRELSTAVS
jgi:exopolyphosphatase / guanosine-5'-triphosphate,3'-diphosphate pyrophosphatase